MIYKLLKNLLKCAGYDGWARDEGCFVVCFAVFINENIISQSRKRKIRTIIRSYPHFYLKKHDTRDRLFSENWAILPNASGTARRGRVFHTPSTCQIAYKIIISGKLIFFFISNC